MNYGSKDRLTSLSCGAKEIENVVRYDFSSSLMAS